MWRGTSVVAKNCKREIYWVRWTFSADFSVSGNRKLSKSVSNWLLVSIRPESLLRFWRRPLKMIKHRILAGTRDVGVAASYRWNFLPDDHYQGIRLLWLIYSTELRIESFLTADVFQNKQRTGLLVVAADRNNYILKIWRINESGSPRKLCDCIQFFLLFGLFSKLLIFCNQ